MKSSCMTKLKNPIKNLHYVVISELPERLQADFRKYLQGKTVPMVEQEKENSMDCAYHSDYVKFLFGISMQSILPPKWLIFGYKEYKKENNEKQLYD